jgi:serine/threonine protein kinase
MKIHQNAKDVALLLAPYLRKHAKGQKVDIPKVQGFVVITARADLTRIAPTERGSVITIDEFVRYVATPGPRVKAFGAVPPTFVSNPLTSNAWKHQLGRFFNVRTGPFKPGQRRYGGFTATSDAPNFEHRAKIYAEYDVVDENAAHTAGTLRIWDFTKADTRFQSAEGRADIAGRERDVIDYLRDRSEECEIAILQPKAEDPERGVSYWEVYDRRRRMKRLSDFASTEHGGLSREERLELARQIIAKVNTLHLVDATHLDIGAHSVWLQAPSAVRLSHLMAAAYPQVRSLGQTRFQFLSSARVPEDVFGGAVDGKRKDVFLIGVAVHTVIFGYPPKADAEDMPPEWEPSVDITSSYVELHPWFESALALVPSDRFSDAGIALDAFNAAIAAKPSAKEVILGLERFQTMIRSQMQLFGTLPPIETLRDDTYRSIWRSERDGRPVFVKMWKRASWGEQVREGPRILDFLTRVRDLQCSPPPNTAAILDVLWLTDAIVLVQEWIEAPSLAHRIREESAVWKQSENALAFLKAMAEGVVALHDSGTAHGDLKPENILVPDGDGYRPTLVDVIDFTATDDGEIQSSAYAPLVGGRYERDRYAVTKIAEDLLSACDVDRHIAADLMKAITECRSNNPANGTLLPLTEALERALTPAETQERPSIRISIRQAETGPVLADEGLFYLRRAPDRPSLFIRGACEEIEVELNDKRQVVRGRRRAIDQKYISTTSKYDFMSLHFEIKVVSADINDFAELEGLLDKPEFIARWGQSSSPRIDVVEEEEEDDGLASMAFGDSAEDALVEAISHEPVTAGHLNVASLWGCLIDAESELTTEGVAAKESSYRKEINRHVVPFELHRGSFEFNRDDRVLVERLNRKAQWWRIGHLDIPRSRPDFVVIDVTRFSTPISGQIVDEDERLRFTSHFEETSLQRRGAAINRILSRQSRVPDLIDVFDPNGRKLPVLTTVTVDPAELENLYV